MPSSVHNVLFRLAALIHLGVTASCAGSPSSASGLHDTFHADSLPLIREYEIDRPDPVLLIRSVNQVDFLPGDRLMIRDGELRRVLIVTREGRLERSFGRPGSGPGEFQWMSDFVPMRGDSVLIADTRTRQFAVFDDRGVIARTFELQVPPSASTMPVPIAELDDGRIIFVAPQWAIPDGESDRMRHSIRVYSGTATATPPDLIASVPNRVQFVEGTARWGSILFTPAAHVAVRDNQLFLAISDSSHITVVNLVTGDERAISHGIPPQAVTAAMIAAERERRRQLPSNLPPFAHESRLTLQAAIERLPAAEMLPAFNGIVVDPFHRIWATACDPIVETRCLAHVLAPDGGVLATIPLPPSFVLHDVDATQIVGVAEYDERGRVIEIRAMPTDLRQPH